METIESFSKQLTIVMIAHRLSTVERCDRVIELNQGCLMFDGSPQVVLAPY
jgi:ATP-binding cassette subfamily B protein